MLAQTGIEIEYLAGRGISGRQVVRAGVGVNPADVEGGVGARFRAGRGIDRPFVLYLGTSAFDKGTVHLVQAMQRAGNQAAQH